MPQFVTIHRARGLTEEDFARLRELSPGFVFARVSGYGQTGPYQEKPGFAAVAEAFGGLRHVVGFPDRPPCRVGISLGDSLAWMFAGLGMLMASYEGVFALLEATLTEYDKTGYERTRTLLSGFARSNLYPCKNAQWIVIAANTDGLVTRLCTLMGREELLTDLRLENQIVRAENRAAIDEIVAAWTAKHEQSELLAPAEAAAMPAGLVYGFGDIVKDSHFHARDIPLSLHAIVVGELKVPGIVPKLSETPGEARWLGPEIGAHNEEVYSGLLNFSPHEIAAIEERGAI